MKLEMTGSNTVTSAKGGASFGAKIGAKSFWLLSSGIYSRKVLAVIREVSCNAMDAHLMSGQAHRPIEVWLPTVEKPVFQVRDYGTGLSEEEVFNLYTTYFESGKDSGDYSSGLFKTDGPVDLEKADAATGGFGLGSKSPFALTDQFTVTSVQNGKKSIFSCAVNHERVPETVKLWEGEADADWPSGIMVTVPVPVSSVDEFVKEAASAFRAFDVQPVFMETEFTLEDPPELVERLGPLVLLDGKGCDADERLCVVRMARVDYPLDISALNLRGDEKHFMKLLTDDTKHHIILEMPTGSIIPAPSREALQYYKGAVNAITEQISKAITAYCTKIYSYLADRDAPTQNELAEARKWLVNWAPVHLSSLKADIKSMMRLLEIPAAAQALLERGSFTAPAVDFPHCDIYVYQGTDSGVGNGVRRSQVLKGLVPGGGKDGYVTLGLHVGTEVMYAEGERVDARVRKHMAEKVLKRVSAKEGSYASTPQVVLIQSHPGAKVPVATLQAHAETYSASLLTTPSSTKPLPDVPAKKGASKSATPAQQAQSAEERLMDSVVYAFVFDDEQMSYEGRYLKFSEIADKRAIGWYSAKKRSWSDPRTTELNNINSALRGLIESGVTTDEVRDMLPEAIIRVHGSQSSTTWGESAALKRVPQPSDFRGEFLANLERIVGGAGVSVKSLSTYRARWMAELLTHSGWSQAKLLERLKVYQDPSPYTAALAACLATPAALRTRIESVHQLAKSMGGGYVWGGCPVVSEQNPTTNVPGVDPNNAKSVHNFLRILDLHEELWLHAQGKKKV